MTARETVPPPVTRTENRNIEVRGQPENSSPGFFGGLLGR
jgi:hypothetical protein